MTKLRNFFILFLSFFILVPFFISLVYADWIRNDNPVLTPNDFDWENLSVAAPSIFKEEGLYKMWYQAMSSSQVAVGYATSSNGLNWTKFINPVVLPYDEILYTETNVEEPSVLKKDDIYIMWYCSYNRNIIDPTFHNPIYKIRLATSPDGINWTKNPAPVLIGTNQWELAGVTDPSVIYHDGKFRMFYGGWGIPKVFRIGYAESVDGINWTKPFGQSLVLPSLGHENGASASFYDGKYHLFYHTGASGPTHIYHASSTDLQTWECEDGCVALMADGTGFDSFMLTGPSILNDDNSQLLYYGGSDGGVWQIGLASNQLAPDPESEAKLIIIPGLFASWNRSAVVYQQSVPANAWQLNPVVKDYNGLLQTFDNLGLQQNTDYFVFAYDWRKSLNSLGDDLSNFIIENNLENEKLILIGHSLGGLVARAYLQQAHPDNVEKIITAGTPHQGVAQVYKALAAGEIEDDNSWWYLAEGLALQLYRQGTETNRQIINDNFPVLNDLLATYPYLYDANNNLIDRNDYQFQNDYLSNLNSSLANLDIYTLSGNKGDTLYAYRLENRTWLDQILDLYPEGHPVAKITEIGDYLVPAVSASIDGGDILSLDHGEIIRKQPAIKKILDKLELNYFDDQIVEGESTNIVPSLFLLMLSSAKLELEINNQIYTENQGMIFVPDYQNEPFVVRALGQSQGDYAILIGNLQNENSQWFKLSGSISSSDPISEIDEYTFSITNNQLVLDQTSLINLISQSPLSVDIWPECLSYIENNKTPRFKICLLKFQHKLIYSLNKSESDSHTGIFQTLSYLENLYFQLDFPDKKSAVYRKMKADYQVLKKKFEHKTLILAKKQKSHKINPAQGYLLTQIEKRLQLASDLLSNSLPSSPEIYLYSIKQLLSQLK